MVIEIGFVRRAAFVGAVHYDGSIHQGEACFLQRELAIGNSNASFEIIELDALVQYFAGIGSKGQVEVLRNYHYTGSGAGTG